MSLSKNKIKLITALQLKKNRQKQSLFIAEGIKVVNEFLDSNIELYEIYCLEEVFDNYEIYKPTLISVADLKRVSSLKTPNKVIAVFKIPENDVFKDEGLVLALDGINDPGNLGTIIRLCDWFGIENLACSKGTVDCYNSKVVQSTMGSLSRVNITYLDLEDYVSNTNQATFIADMDGENIYKSKMPTEGVLIMGNEANGISDEIRKKVSHKISIPRFGPSQQTESLNVATATAILLSEFKRNL